MHATVYDKHEKFQQFYLFVQPFSWDCVDDFSSAVCQNFRLIRYDVAKLKPKRLSQRMDGNNSEVRKNGRQRKQIVKKEKNCSIFTLKQIALLHVFG